MEKLSGIVRMQTDGRRQSWPVPSIRQKTW